MEIYSSNERFVEESSVFIKYNLYSILFILSSKKLSTKESSLICFNYQLVQMFYDAINRIITGMNQGKTSIQVCA
jgi:hypothetical protein